MISPHRSGLPAQPASRLATMHQWRGAPGLASAELDLRRLLGRFAPVGLAQMDRVALLDRTDTKYVLDAQRLSCALLALTEDYWALDIDGLRQNLYQTLYFDTADFALYLHHHGDRRCRCKVRSRCYVDTEQSFLEVKVSTNRNRTSKSRMPTPALVTCLTPEADEFVRAHWPLGTQALEPKLWNEFSRITLVSKHSVERVTLDLNLAFRNDHGVVALPGVAVAEVKQDRVNYRSCFMRQMRSLGIRPVGFSKYCIGVSFLYASVKHNNFKPNLLWVAKMMRGNGND